MFRAKFKVNSVEEIVGSQTVNASPVTSSCDENRSFHKYTPWGDLKINITKETPAYGQLEPGQEFYLDFTPIKKE